MNIVDDTDAEILIQYPVERVLVSTRSEQQKIVIAKTVGFGEALFLDNHIQSCTADEYIYHEMMAHSLLLGLKKRKRILVLGSAEGCLLREILKWNDVEEVDLVDWDETLVKLFQGPYRHWNDGAFEDPRVRVYCEDAMAFLQNTEKKYDAIFLDLLDPTEGNLPFLLALIHDCKCHLEKEGGLIVNGGSVVPGKANFCQKVAHYLAIFPEWKRFAMHIEVPSFIQQWCLLLLVPESWGADVCLQKFWFRTRRFTQESLQRAISWEKDFAEWLREP